VSSARDAPSPGIMAIMSQPALDLEFDDGADPTFTVGELTDAVNQVLRRGFRDGVWVRGEIEGIQQRNGHVYFSLTDHTDDGRASIAVALFANTWYRLRPVLARHRLRLANGLAVRIHAVPNLYAPTGRLSLVMDGIDVRFTLGKLAADRDALLARLTEAGLVGRNAALPLPLVPLRIGLVASRGSAAWHDVLHELDGSGIGFRIAHVDVRVQGSDAAPAVAAALRTLSRRPVDVIVVVRGGGSRTDLAAFDDEAIALAIARAPVPVLTGLGHEVDRSVADHVAHTAYKTPTACAAALVDRVRQFDAAVAAVGRGVAARTTLAVRLADQRLDHTAGRLRREVAAGLDAGERRLVAAGERLGGRSEAAVRQSEHGLDVAAARLRVLDPAAALARGWSITRRADGTLVRSTAGLAAGEALVTTVADGTVTSVVSEAAS
jgi:exodeoxyribonuclease VII large subunit